MFFQISASSTFMVETNPVVQNPGLECLTHIGRAHEAYWAGQDSGHVCCKRRNGAHLQFGGLSWVEADVKPQHEDLHPASTGMVTEGLSGFLEPQSFFLHEGDFVNYFNDK